jgi:hypothetical protein
VEKPTFHNFETAIVGGCRSGSEADICKQDDECQGHGAQETALVTLAATALPRQL